MKQLKKYGKKKDMKSDDELDDKTGYSTIKKGGEDKAIRARSTKSEKGIHDPKLSSQVVRSKRGKDEEGSPKEDKFEARSGRKENESQKMRRILTEQGAIGKKKKFGLKKRK